MCGAIDVLPWQPQTSDRNPVPAWSSARKSCAVRMPHIKIVPRGRTMKVDIQIPEYIGQQLQREWLDVPRRVLEAVAVEAYRSGALSREQVGDLLGISFWQTEAFLKEHQAYLDYGVKDLEEDRASLKRILP